MLVLTRKKGQKLIINDNIEITILETRGEVVKIGIEAPREVTIFREEIYEEIKKANEQATQEVVSADLDQFLGLNQVKKDISSDYLNKIKSFSTRSKPDNDNESQ